MGQKMNAQKKQNKSEKGNNFKILYRKLLEYVLDLCDEAENKCNNNKSRTKLALNLARSDALILEDLVGMECEKRGWIKI